MAIALALRASPVAQPRKPNLIFEEIYNSKCSCFPYELFQTLSRDITSEEKNIKQLAVGEHLVKENLKKEVVL